MQAEVLTVTELTEGIKHLLEMSFDRICVRGEISNLARPNSGHLYFNLKDEHAQIRGVMFRSAAQRSKFDLENGLEVFLHGRISVYEPRGEYQIIVDRVEPFGAGALQLAFEQLKERLSAEGLFNPDLKKEIPFLPKAIGIVTSPTGAAIQDILNILDRRFPGIPVIINPVLVQGEQAAGDIANAINQFNQLDSVNVLIVGRGGGSMEDLWAFNEEVVARAIYNSSIPVISAVGHETDFTIADFVADLRAPTPSAAAELVVPLKEYLVFRVSDASNRIENLVIRKIKTEAERLNHLSKRLRSPKAVIQTYMMKIDDLNQRLSQTFENRLSLFSSKVDSLSHRLRLLSPLSQIGNYRQQLSELSSLLETRVKYICTQKRNKAVELTHVLDSVSPLATMTRGYSFVTQPSGRVVSEISQVKMNANLIVNLKDGKLETRVEKILPKEVGND
ncbi:exodeoxyribonuclease VII large subunit [bacterium]|nr:exodeoxyribonuclease VII large subunit [bacterium]